MGGSASYYHARNRRYPGWPWWNFLARRFMPGQRIWRWNFWGAEWEEVTFVGWDEGIQHCANLKADRGIGFDHIRRLRPHWHIWLRRATDAFLTALVIAVVLSLWILPGMAIGWVLWG